LGDELYRATVLDQTILGGTSMIAYTARYDALGSGELPRSGAGITLIDTLDVADLESEAAHRYELGPTRETENLALSYQAEGGEVADGARVARAYDRFTMHGRAGASYRVVARFISTESSEVEARIGTQAVARLHLSPSGWTETAFDIPDALSAEEMTLTMVDATGTRFGSAHYWLYER
jgi:hypothetical protein